MVRLYSTAPNRQIIGEDKSLPRCQFRLHSVNSASKYCMDGAACDTLQAPFRMRTILVGTASWTDNTLIASGRFYPPKCTTAEDRLRYYASQFPFVEVDSCYYAIPDPQVAQLWAERTPPSFLFNVKAFRLLSGHQTAPAVLPKDIAKALGPIANRNLYYKDAPAEIREAVWERFRLGLEPLQRAGKLVAVHFQFAPWVAFHPRNLEHIDECRERLRGLRLVVEFRNKTWFEGRHAQQTLDFER